MVPLSSARRDRWLLAPVWVLTLAVLGVGIGLLVPILIFWGAVGLIGAIFATRILLRDVRSEGDAPAATRPPGDETPNDEEHAR
jgi:hypothetical protein